MGFDINSKTLNEAKPGIQIQINWLKYVAIYKRLDMLQARFSQLKKPNSNAQNLVAV